jgi:hypothetical protein
MANWFMPNLQMVPLSKLTFLIELISLTSRISFQLGELAYSRFHYTYFLCSKLSVTTLVRFGIDTDLSRHILKRSFGHLQIKL